MRDQIKDPTAIRNTHRRNLPATLLLAPTTCCLIGCKGPHVYHPTDSVIADPETNFYTAFIEFDDQGELWAPAQISNAVKAIKTNNPVFLVTYIHGWKNNAETNNQNFIHFTNMLHAVAKELPGHRQAKVFGVYMAWRGDPVALHDPISWVARQLSFWSRTAAAERVAGTSATEALYSVLQAANANPNSKVVLVGHSMGALILEKALSQAMVSTLLLQTNRAPKPPADLVVLINAASPSIYARQLISMLGRLAPEDTTVSPVAGVDLATYSSDRPLIISATSQGDWATGKVFPLGMSLSGLTKAFRQYGTNEHFSGKQSKYYTATACHNKSLWSHKIVRVDTGKSSKQRSTLQGERQALRQNLAPKRDPYTFEIEDRRYRIVPIPDRENNTPYWVMQVPTTIIKDHDDIFNQRLTGFMGALFRLTQVTERATPRLRLDKKSFAQKAD